jgi:hypothetical protein
MKPTKFIFEAPRRSRRRAIELYDNDTPFRPKRERSALSYTRKIKHPQRDWQ